MNEALCIRVLVVDDHPLMRSGIAGEVNAQPDMKVIAEADNAEDAIALFRLHRPDVTLMDVRMPGLNGIDAVSVVRSEFPNARIVILTTAAGDVQAVRAFKAGAAGYLLKNLLRTELISTIRLANAGSKRIPSEVAQHIAEHAMDEQITDRELDVLRGVARGNSNKVIAATLHISEHTVKNHVKSIMAKLAATDRTHAVMIALRRGFLDMG